VTSQERVLVEISAGVADVRLNRPDKLNALDAAMFEAIGDTIDALGKDTSVRAVVLSGEGRAFCAGLDMASLAAMAGADRASTAGLAERKPGDIANRAQLVAYGWSLLAVPVIAAVHGVALGGGAQIALGADIRLMAPDAKISIFEISWGLVPDMSATVTLPRLVGADVAKELAWTARMVTGEEASRIGLATRCCEDPHGEALRLAADIASRNPDAVRAAKRLFSPAQNATVADLLAAESAEMAALIGSTNQAEAVRARLEGRQPVFVDPDLG
jgi:enoyl-CoA hydratase/carnithine racemase